MLEADKYSYFVESINGISTIKALSTEEDAYARGEIIVLQTIDANLKLGKSINIQNTLQTFFSQCGLIAIYWYGSSLIMNNQLSLGQLISFVTLLGYFTGPLGRLICLQPQLQEIGVACNRFKEILDLPTEDRICNGSYDKETFNENIEFKNISFSYGTRGKTLDEINFTIQKGEKVAFVGPSGSGKTTIIKLLLKFYHQDKGDILIDNQNTKEIKTDSFRALFGYVPQDILLFSGTIAENIAWGYENATYAQIRSAAYKAGALDFIILLLDEATSNLDSITEAQILNAITDLAKDTTSIIVAHRLSTIKHCDKIFVVNKGKVLESGNHTQLLAQNGFYKQMWVSQNQSKK